MAAGKSIFAIEGEWSNSLKSGLTIKSSIHFLNEVYGIPYIFRKTNNQESLITYLRQCARYNSYGILMLSFHGSSKGLTIAKGQTISLDKLGEQCAGMFSDKIIHFSSCSIARSVGDLEKFKEITCARKVMGYRKDVDFLESTLFDIALLHNLHHYDRLGYVPKNLEKKYRSLYSKLDFVMV